MNISNVTIPPVGLSSKRSTQHKKPLTLVVRVFGGWAAFNRPKVIQLDINDADGLQSAEQFRLAYQDLTKDMADRYSDTPSGPLIIHQGR